LWSLWPTVKLQNLSSEERDELAKQGRLENIESKAIKQGLDLKGGMYIVLEVDLPTLVENIAINKDQKLTAVLASIRKDISNQPEADFFNLFSNKVEDKKS
jgi:preprotein translocase subunit SecD